MDSLKQQYYDELCGGDTTEFTKQFFDRFWNGLCDEMLHKTDEVYSEWQEYLSLYEIETF